MGIYTLVDFFDPSWFPVNFNPLLLYLAGSRLAPFYCIIPRNVELQPDFYSPDNTSLRRKDFFSGKMSEIQSVPVF